jgi:hypothetical protein
VKTAQTIAQSAERRPESTSGTNPKRKIARHPNSLANLVAPWTPETAPKGKGRPRDVAAEISRAAIERNQEEIYKAIVQKLMAGDAYAFSVHSDRGYGKLKQGIIHTGDEDGGPVRTSITVEFVSGDGK